MKIVGVRSTPVTVPFTRPEIWARGARPCITNIIVEIQTDNGLVGLGEAGGGDTADEVAVVLKRVSRYLVGEDPFDLIERLRQRLRYCLAPSAFYALETALLDIQGKATGQPLYKVLGGAVRRQVPFMYYLLRDKPDVMAKEAVVAVKAGFGTIYIKVGIDVEEDLEVIAAVRAAIGPKPKLRIDPNETWTVGTAARLFYRLREYDIELVEDPLSHEDLAGWKRLRASALIPVAAQETARTLPDILRVIKEGAADIILVDPARNGGLSGMKRAAAVAEAAGLPVYVHSGGDLGIATAALTHALTTIPNNLLASQTYFAFLSGDVIKEKINSFVEGCLAPSDKPGLGVTLDREKLAHYHDIYERQEVVDGAYRRDDLSHEVSEEESYFPKF